jgi:hypothetical protein
VRPGTLAKAAICRIVPDSSELEWLVVAAAVNTGDVGLMDRAYALQTELLEKPEVIRVAMSMDEHGVTLTITELGGGKRVEFVAKEG